MNEFEVLLDQLNDLIEESWRLPLSNGKVVLDKDDLTRIVNGLQTHYPTEISRAKNLLEDREKILLKARTDADRMKKEAETKSARLLDEQDIIRESKRLSAELLAKATTESEEIRKRAIEFADTILKRAEEHYDQNLAVIRQARRVVKDQQ